jgi:hypothetical protein
MTTIDVHSAPTTRARQVPIAADRRVPSPRAAIGWLAGGAAVTFAASFIASDVMGVQHDLYLLFYFTFALGYLAWFATKSGVGWRRMLRTNLWWSVAVGALVALAVVQQVMSQHGTAHPTGGYFGFELVWRGVVYGTVDALVLAVFPAAVAWLVMRGNRKGIKRKVAFAGLVVVFSLGVGAAYHAGYSTYRGNTMTKPLTGAVLWDVPTILTGNPAGAIAAHAAVHASAVVHQYYGGDNHLLPPELTADYPQNAGGAAGQAIAAGWLVLVSSVLVLTRRRWLPAFRESAHN